MGLFRKSDKNTNDNKNFKELNRIKRALATNGKKPEVKLSDNISMSYDMFTTGRNANVLLFGGNEDERKARHIAPNIKEFNRSYIITDSSRKLYNEFMSELESRGYTVCLYDLCDVSQLTYNPMAYVFNEMSAGRLARAIIENIENESIHNDSRGMWEEIELKLLSIIIYALSQAKKNSTMKDVVDILNGGMASLDGILKSVSAKTAESYKKLKQDVSAETLKGVFLLLAEKLKMFNAWDKGMTSEEVMADAREYVFSKKALFVNMPDDSEGIRMPGICILQVTLVIAHEMSLKGINYMQYPIQFMLNEIEKIGKISGIEEMLEESSELSFAFSIFAASLNNLQCVSRNKFDKIVEYCDAAVCLSNVDADTAGWMSREYDEKDGRLIMPENEEIKELAENLEENWLLVKIRGFRAVKDAL